MNGISMIKIKGSGIQSQINFVRDHFGDDGFSRWTEALSPAAKKIVASPIFASSWYEGEHAVLELRNNICAVFFGNDPRGARKIGAYTAEKALTGIYRIFVRFGAPEWVICRATRIFGTFFEPGIFNRVETLTGGMLIRLTDFPAKSDVFEETICGFTQRALELSGCVDVEVERICSIVRGDPHSDFKATWRGQPPHP